MLARRIAYYNFPANHFIDAQHIGELSRDAHGDTVVGIRA